VKALQPRKAASAEATAAAEEAIARVARDAVFISVFS
jgi:hypothetical protein